VKALLPALFAVSALSTSGRLLAEPWSTQPLIGVVGQYTSNPELLARNAQSETNGALVLNAPVNYDSDDFHFSVTPNIRYGNASGYSSITSDFFHLDSLARLDTERSSTSVSASLYRDSSLLYAGELSNGVGVRRDTSAIAVNWQDSLTERLLLQLGASTFRTLYAQTTAPSGAPEADQSALLGSLVDYRYTTFSPALALVESDRNTVRIIGSAGRYQALDDISDSNSAILQLGFDRQLSEIWSLKTTAGYSRAENRYNFFFGKYLLGVIDSTQTGTVYSATLSRQSEVLNLNFGASRSLAPTGFAYLTRQEGVNLGAGYKYSERWSYGAIASWQTDAYPETGGGSFARKYYNAALSVSWQWTEQWAVTLQATKVVQVYGSPSVSGASSGVNVEISRQFYRKDL
jgi:hypothetical protein